MSLHVRLDADETAQVLTRFIRDYVTTSGAEGLVLGLSGGIDSALVARLAVDAVGTAHVHAFALPAATSDPDDLADAQLVAEHLGLELQVRSVADMVAAAQAALAVDGAPDRRTVANLTARARMALLYAEAQRHGALVVGTGNKSELLTGYFTKHGDGGVDLLPIGDLYKTQVRALARHLGLPERIVSKVPSAGLWQGQTDEAELGLPYATLDQVLLGLEVALPPARIARDADVPLAEVERVDALRRASQHKRVGPLVCKLGIRSQGTDWREPVTGAAGGV